MLGFLALITFMIVQSEVLLAVSELVFGDEMHMRAGQGRVDDLGYADCHEEVALAKQAAKASGGPCASRPKWWLLKDCEDQALFQMLRHRFVQGKLPSNFQFSNYQSRSFLSTRYI